MLKAIFKNSSYLLSAQVAAKIVSFFYAFYLARQLGVVDFGQYSVALSYFSVVSSVVDLGVSRYLIREISKAGVLFPLLFINSLVLRLIFSIVLVTTSAVALYLTDHDQTRAFLSIIALCAVIPQVIGLTFDAGLVVLNKFKYSAFGILLLNFSTVLIGVMFLSYQPSAVNALLAVVLGHILYMAGLLFLLLVSTRDLKGLFRHIDHKTIAAIFKGSIWYGILSMLGLIYFKVDTLLLSYLRGSYDAGIYSVAYRFLEGIVFIPAAFEAAFYPVLSKMNLGERRQSFRLYLKSLGLMFLLSVPFVLSFWLVVPILIHGYLKNDYSASAGIVSILSLAIPFIFALAAQGALLLSSEKYLKSLIWVSLFNLILNIIGNVLFIPSSGVYAAAWMTVISQVMVFLIYFIFIYYAFGRQND